MDTEERNVKQDAEREWQALLDENARRFEERTKLLQREGVQTHLDGENHYKDIDEWFQLELSELKRKYDIA